MKSKRDSLPSRAFSFICLILTVLIVSSNQIVFSQERLENVSSVNARVGKDPQKRGPTGAPADVIIINNLNSYGVAVEATLTYYSGVSKREETAKFRVAMSVSNGTNKTANLHFGDTALLPLPSDASERDAHLAMLHESSRMTGVKVDRVTYLDSADDKRVMTPVTPPRTGGRGEKR